MKDKETQLSFFNVIGKNEGKTKEDEAIEKTLETNESEECLYHICDGSGMIRKKNDNGATYVDFCQCYHDKVLKQKLNNAKISSNFLNKDFNFDDGKTNAFLFKPNLTVPEIKIKKKNQSLEEALLEENTNDFINRHFTKIEQTRKPGEIFCSFSEKNLELFSNGKKPSNLILFGDPGNGKTSFACLIGTYFLKHNKKVYFANTEDFLNSIYDKKVNVDQISKEYDVLILDEFFDEYHTDSQWAKKKIKKMLKIRDENNLMTICTSNGNPKEFSLLYGDSIMSLLKGTFFFFYLEREGDGRVERMYQRFDDFGF